MPSAVQPPGRNDLLAALPGLDYRRLARYLEPVALTFAQVLYEPGDLMQHVYFPTGGVISLLSVASMNKAAEVGVVGYEGVIGASTALGNGRSNTRAVVQATGAAVRIGSSRLRRQLADNVAWYRVLLRFTHALLHQTSQTAACNRFHTVEARLARWLLAMRDRVHSNHLQITQEFISLMLGVRRVGVTVAAANLQNRRLIAYTRGNIQLIDPAGLETAACECYAKVRETYRRSHLK